jgi:hypothetical protein
MRLLRAKPRLGAVLKHNKKAPYHCYGELRLAPYFWEHDNVK